MSWMKHLMRGGLGHGGHHGGHGYSRHGHGGHGSSGHGHGHGGHGHGHGHDSYDPCDEPPLQTYVTREVSAPQPMPAGVRCSGCGAVSPNGSRFCGTCGVSLLPKGCTSCGGAIQPGARFCPECGAQQTQVLDRPR